VSLRVVLDFSKLTSPRPRNLLAPDRGAIFLTIEVTEG